MRTTRHGCCVDKACNADTCMALPKGVTCGDCKSLAWCKSLFQCPPTNTSCDWFPRRFRATTATPVAEVSDAR